MKKIISYTFQGKHVHPKVIQRDNAQWEKDQYASLPWRRYKERYHSPQTKVGRMLQYHRPLPF